MIAIINYGMGNIHSVQKALEYLGARTLVTDDPADLKGCEKIVLPGVGAFDDAMKALQKKMIPEGLVDNIAKKKAFLGICLGMQLLFEESQEASSFKGLGILKGSVEKFVFKEHDLKVPHMGWNRLDVKNKACPLFDGMENNPYVYFCHSYYAKPKDPSVSAAVTSYGEDFSSVAWKDNIYGVQFHPEKSQEAGMKILKNFVEI